MRNRYWAAILRALKEAGSLGVWMHKIDSSASEFEIWAWFARLSSLRHKRYSAATGPMLGFFYARILAVPPEADGELTVLTEAEKSDI